jgi:pyridinium-3,5-bisthiocarboxylic acid mononucleotide nickel chelatase
MKILYFDCFSGISGDMILGALFDAGLSIDAFLNELKKLPLKGYEIKISKTTKNSISGTAFRLTIDNDSGHRHLKEILDIVEKSDLNLKIKDKAKIIFMKLAEVESRIHKTPIEEVHFHELGGIDTIIDIVGALIGLDLLGVENIISSPIPLGKGLINTEHGLLPIPAPATIELLKNVPVYSNNIEGELVTPTGAVLISSLSDNFSDIPKIKISSIGYGAGKIDLPIPNLLRVYIGEQIINTTCENNLLIEANIDDMNPQIYEYVVDKLFQNGALDVFLTPIIMKKGRPGIIISIIASQFKEKELINILFKETTTIGYRKYYVEKTFLNREISELETKWGKVRVKVIKQDSILKYSPEYEDCKKIAIENKLPLKDVIESILMIINKLYN